jgi:hypothetical protein
MLVETLSWEGKRVDHHRHLPSSASFPFELGQISCSLTNHCRNASTEVFAQDDKISSTAHSD